MWGRKAKPADAAASWKPDEQHPDPSHRGFEDSVARAAEFIADSQREPAVADAAHSDSNVVARPFVNEGPQGHRKRMRQRLLERGPDSLADYELLEMLLFFAQPTGDTKPVAKRLINRFGSYAAALSAPTQALSEVSGIGPVSVAAFRLVHAAAVRLARAEVLDRIVLSNWDQLMDYLQIAMARERVEQFRILFLDTKNQLIADEVQGRGTINHTPVYPREVARRALELFAAAIILVHNHPSGDPTPSRADIDMTEQIRRVLKMLDITLHDHVIVGNGRWISLSKEGFL